MFFKADRSPRLEDEVFRLRDRRDIPGGTKMEEEGIRGEIIGRLHAYTAAWISEPSRLAERCEERSQSLMKWLRV